MLYVPDHAPHCARAAAGTVHLHHGGAPLANPRDTSLAGWLPSAQCHDDGGDAALFRPRRWPRRDRETILAQVPARPLPPRSRPRHSQRTLALGNSTRPTCTESAARSHENPAQGDEQGRVSRGWVECSAAPLGEGCCDGGA